MNITEKYFEDIELNHAWQSRARTITETDIVGFAGLSGDFNPLHMDEVFAKSTMFGQRIAHGLLGLSVASGLESVEAPWKIMAFMGLEWKFKKPIFIGDTIRHESKVIAKKELSDKDRGIIKLERNLLNQNQELVQTGVFTLLVSRKT